MSYNHWCFYLVLNVDDIFKMIRPQKLIKQSPKYDFDHLLIFKRIQKVRDDFEFNKSKIKQMWREK